MSDKKDLCEAGNSAMNVASRNLVAAALLAGTMFAPPVAEAVPSPTLSGYTIGSSAGTRSVTITTHTIAEQTKYYNLTTGATEVSGSDSAISVAIKNVTSATKYANYNSGSTDWYDNDTIGTTGTINRNFFAGNKWDGNGAGIFNTLHDLEAVKGNFIYKCIFATTETIYGAGMLNDNRTISDGIYGDFIGNNITFGNPDLTINEGYGGAIALIEASNVGTIKGLFYDNFINSFRGAYGGAIYNAPRRWADSGAVQRIGTLEGGFYNNHVLAWIESGNMWAYGGALFNNGVITTIQNSEFANNYTNAYYSYNGVYNYNGYSAGGAIYNSGVIGSLTADFLNNSANTSLRLDGTDARGGAIYNSGDIGYINGTFQGNKTIGAYDSAGGAIYNEGTLGANGFENVVFYNNYATTDTGKARGGAISNEGSGVITNLNATFAENYVTSDSAAVYGGAIYNSATIDGTLDGTFVANYVESTSGNSYGGAISNSGNIATIAADFIGNTSGNYGGAIHNEGTITEINGSTFSGNKSNNGGAVNAKTDAVIGDITATFNSNSATNNAGAVRTAGSLGDINSTFTSNSAGKAGGAIYTSSGGSIGDVSSTFTGNTAGTNGGAIANLGTTESITSSSFSQNSAVSGGALYNTGTVGDVSSTSFTGNYATDGGAIYNSAGNVSATRVLFENNVAQEGSAIYNMADMIISDSTFSGNTGNSYIYNSNSGVLGITSTVDLTISNGTIANIVNDGKLNITSGAGKTITIEDAIVATAGKVGNVHLYNSVAFNDLIKNQNLTVESGNLTITNTTGDDFVSLDSVVLLNKGTATLTDVNVSGGSINTANGATTNIVSDNVSETLIEANILGSGTVVKTGDSDSLLTLTGNNSQFTGDLNILAGTVRAEVNNKNKFFNNAEILVDGNSQKLEYVSSQVSTIMAPISLDSSFANINLKDGATFELTGRNIDSSAYELNSGWLTSSAGVNNLIFNDAIYNLNTDFAIGNTASDDKVSFNNSTVLIGDNLKSGTVSTVNGNVDNYDIGGATYTLTDSTLDLSNQVVGNNYNFKELNFSGSNNKLAIDLNLTLDKLNNIMPYTDTITAESGSGIVNITKIFVTDDNGMFLNENGELSKGIIQIFKGNNTLKVAVADNLQLLSWATNIYKYGIESATTPTAQGGHEQDSIRIIPKGVSSSDTLRDLNLYDPTNTGVGGNRGFSFVAKEGKQEYNVYNPYRDLNSTTKGTFSVLGAYSTDENKKSVLDGTLKDLVVEVDDIGTRLVEVSSGVWYYYEPNKIDYKDVSDYITFDANGNATISKEAFSTDTYGSMFELVNATEFEASNVTIQNAMRYADDVIKDGSVIYANNSDAKVLLENVDFVNNTAAGNGGAIANIASTSFVIEDSIMSGNSANNGGVIYNTAEGLILNGIKADGNQATLEGGAIYTEADMLISNSSFGVNALNTVQNGTPNDIYVGSSAEVTFMTSQNKTSHIMSGISGNGIFTKTGAGTLDLSGNNSRFLGDFVVKEGTVNYTKAVSDGAFAQGNISIGKDAVLSMDIASGTDTIKNISDESSEGTGTLIKKGLGNLSLSGDNSDFTGKTQISEGSLVYNASNSSNSYFGGVTEINDGANLTLNIADTVNQVVSGITSVTQTSDSTATITKNGMGNLTLTGDLSSYYGQTTINSGKLIYLAESVSDKYLNGNTIINSDAVLEANVANNITQNIANISGTGSFDVVGHGTLILGGSNSGFTGTTTIKDGVLAYTKSAGTSYVGGTTEINENGTLQYTVNTNDSDTITKVSGNGTLNKQGTGVLNSTGDNSGFTGTVEVSAGTLSYTSGTGNKFFSAKGYDLSTGASLDITNSTTDNVTVQNVTGAGTLNKDGVGTLILGGTNSGFTGTTTIKDGVLAYTKSAGTSYVGGTTEINENGTLEYTVNTSDSDIITKVSGTGVLNKQGAGLLTSTGDNSGFTGTVEVSAGTLSYTSGTDNKFFSASKYDIASGASLDITNSTTDNVTVQNVTGTGTLNKDGVGTLILGGSNSGFTGTTTIKDGVLAYTKSAGTSYVGGNTEINENGTLEYTVNTSDSDIITKVSGTGVFEKLGDGTLNINGNNSAFKGLTNVTEGVLSYTANTDIDRYYAGATVVGQNAELKLNIAQGVENQTIKQIASNDNTALVTKTGAGNLDLLGDNSGYTAVLDITQGSVSFVDNADNTYINGVTKLSNGTNLNYVAQENATLTNIEGSGNVNYSGNASLTINAAANNNFAGVVNSSGSQLNVGGLKTDAFDFDVVVNSGKLNYAANTGANITINSNSTAPQISFGNSSDANSSITFNGGTYVLKTEIANSAGRDVIFDDVTLKLGASTYSDANYVAKDSIIDLIDNVVSSHTFENLTTNNTELRLDVKFDAFNTHSSDKLTVNNNGGDIKLTLTDLNIDDSTVNMEQVSENGLGLTHRINVLGGELTFDSTNSVGKWATNAYIYDVETDHQDLLLTAIKASSDDSLDEMNDTSGTRGFQFFDSDTNPYVVKESLGAAADGIFTVNGANNGATVISGDNKSSIFEITSNTDLRVNDLKISDAKGSNGSAVLANNANAKVALDNVDLESNASTGNGGAISNINSNKFTVSDANISNNTAAGNGGAIYTEDNMTITNSNFSSNTANGLGGAIYTSSSITIVDSSFASNTDKNGSNDIYLDGANAVVDFVVNNTSSIGSGIAGTGTLNKDGVGTLILGGTNSGFTGTTTIKDGVLAYTKSAGTSYVGGNTEINENGTLEYTVNTSDSDIITKVSGNGTLNKQGTGVLNSTGDNSGFTGTVEVSAGTLSYTSGTDNKFFSASKYDIASGASLDITNTVTDNVTVQNVTGTGTLNKDGVGTLILGGSNSGFTGTTTIKDGVLAYTKSAGTSYVGGNTEINENGTLQYTVNDNDNLTKVSGNGTLNKQGTGVLNSTGDNSGFTGTVEVSAGTLSYTSGTDNKFFSASKYDIASGSSLDITNSTTDNVTVQNVTGAGTLNKDGVGTLILGGSNSGFTGTTTIKDGVLAYTKSAGTSYVGGNTEISENGTLQYTVNDNDNLTKVSGNGTLNKQGTGVLNSTGDNSGFTGTVEVSAGTLSYTSGTGNKFFSAKGYDLSTDATLDITNSTTDNVTVQNVTGAGTLNKDGVGTLILGGSNSGFTGTTTIKDGVLAYTKSAGTSYVGGNTEISENGTLQYTVNDNDNLTKVSGNGTLNKQGTGVLNSTGDNSGFTGTVEVSAGTLSYTSGTDNKFFSASKYDIASGASLDITNTTAENIEISNLIGAGEFNKSGAGYVSLSGKNNLFWGTLNVKDGNLDFIQKSADDTYIAGATTIASGSKVTIVNSESDLVIGNFSGDGDLVIAGLKDVTLKGDNSNLTGDFNIEAGNVMFDADTDKYVGGNTNISLNSGLVIKNNSDYAISKLAGLGTLVKDGKGSLIIDGNNNDFKGNLAVNSGVFAMNADATIGTLNNATFANGTGINLQNTTYTLTGTDSYITTPNPPSIQNLRFVNLTLNGDVDFDIDIDLKNQIADNIYAANVLGNGNLILDKDSLNVVSESLLKDTIVNVASGALTNRVILADSVASVMGPIQRYNVHYENGDLRFHRGSIAPTIDDVNPSVMVTPVATQVGGYLTQLETLHAGFYHMDRYANYTSMQRMAAEKANHNAIVGTPAYNTSQLPETSKGMWIKPYTSFESVGLKGGVKVSNTTYGSFYGGDSDLVDLGKGYKGVISTFVGYNGSHQSYSGVNLNNNGGALGFTGTLYKGNFFTGLTASTGASSGDATTYYGTEHYTMLTAGVANKTGYNWEINGGKLIVQPSLFLGYTFVNTFDYTNAAGVSMDSDPLHAIQIVPGVKFIGNLENGWQPYASVNMVWNIMDKTNVMANDVRLPQLSVKPYVEYGIGLQKTWGDRFTGYFQSMVRNGGRTGVALSMGFRWALGKDAESTETVKQSKPIKEVKLQKTDKEIKTVEKVTVEKKQVIKTDSVKKEKISSEKPAVEKQKENQKVKEQTSKTKRVLKTKKQTKSVDRL